MNRLQNSWSLAKTSWGVLRQDQELLWLPVLSFLSWAAIAALVFIPIFSMSGTDPVTGDRTFDVGPLVWVVMFAGAVALTYVTIFFRAAILHAADERLRGGNPTVGSALRGASARAGRLLPWAIVSVVVSTVLRALEERSGIVGRIVLGFVGLAWSLVTFLVLPVIMMEDLGVSDSIRRSADLFKRTWGENVAAQAGFSIIGIVAMLPGLFVAMLLFSFGGAGVVLGVAIGVAWVAAASVVLSALGAIFQMALYRFAVDGVAPPAFAHDDLAGSFAPRRRGRGLI